MRLGVLALIITSILGCKPDGESQISIKNKESYVNYSQAILSPTKDMVGEIYSFRYSIDGERADRNNFYERLEDGDFLYGRNDMKLLRENKDGKLMIREHDLKGYTAKYIKAYAFEPQVLDVLVDPEENTMSIDLKASEKGQLVTYVYGVDTGLPITALPFNQAHFSGAYDMTVFIRDKTSQKYRFVIMIGDKICIKEYNKSDLY